MTMIVEGSIRWGVSRTGNIYTLALDNLTRDEVKEFLLTMHNLQRDGQRAAVTAMSAETLSLSEEVITSILRHEEPAPTMMKGTRSIFKEQGGPRT